MYFDKLSHPSVGLCLIALGSVSHSDASLIFSMYYYLYKCKSLADSLEALKCPNFPQVNEYLASLRLNTCPEFIGKKMNATFEYTDCMCITVSPVREVRALSQRDVGEGRFWVEGDAYKQ